MKTTTTRAARTNAAANKACTWFTNKTSQSYFQKK